MSEEQEDLELKALERRLEDAFLTTRPRTGFEDELWTRMQAQRPVGSRFRDALSGLVQGIRQVPAVPLAGLAAVLVVVIGVGLIGYVGVGHGGGGGASSAPGFNQESGQTVTATGFGKLPAPILASTTRPSGNAASPVNAQTPSSPEYSGPIQLEWTGTNVNIGTASVFRYREPTATTADQFAAALGAAPRGRPAGYLGSYVATDYTLEIRGTVPSPPQSPAYFIYSSPSMPAIEAAGAGPGDLANVFLAAHSLTPQWNYNVVIDSSGNLTRVILQRQFDAAGYGPAYLVDTDSQRYGMEVDLNGNRVEHVVGVLPVSLDTAAYTLVPSDEAFRNASAAPTQNLSTPAPVVKLTQVELAYLLVPAGEHSYYEPVYVFSGTFQLNGTTYTKHLIAPAVDPSLLTR